MLALKLSSSGFGLRRVAAAVAIVFAMVITSGYFAFDADGTDAHADWLVARAAWNGDAYRDVRAIAIEYGVPFEVASLEDREVAVAQHPRLPGALLLQTVLLMLPYAAIWKVAVVVNALLLSALVVWHSSAVTRWRWFVLTVGIAYSLPAYLALRNASQVVFVATLVSVAAPIRSAAPRVLRRTSLALAVVLKIFPGAALLTAGRRAAIYVLSVVAGINILGLALPGVTIRGLSTVLGSASDAWLRLPSNGSLASLFASAGLPTAVAVGMGAMLAGGIAILFVRQTRDVEWVTYFGLIVIGLLGVPLSWAAYDIVLIPAIWYLAEINVRYPQMIVLTWVATFAIWIVGVSSMPPSAFAALNVGSRLVVLVLLWKAGTRDAKPHTRLRRSD